MRKSNVPWRQAFDGKSFKGDLNKEYKVTGIPFTLLIGRNGKIAAMNLRSLLLEPAIKMALAEPQ